MNKKIILLLVIACIISAIAFKAFAGTAGGSGLAGVGPNCSAGSISTFTNFSTANAGITTVGFSTSTITLNVTCATPASCYNASATNLVINNDTVLKSCDGRTKEYLAQNITGNFTNVSNVQVSVASLDLVVTADNGGKFFVANGVDKPTSAEMFIPNYGTVKDAKLTEEPYKEATFKENNLRLIAIAGTQNNNPAIGGILVDATNAPVAAIVGQINEITLSAGYQIQLGKTLITQDLRNGDSKTYGDYAITYITVKPSAVAPTVSYLVSFQIDTNTQTITFAYGGLTRKFSDPGNNVEMKGITQLYTPNGLSNEGAGNFARIATIATIGTLGTIITIANTDGVVEQSRTVALASPDPLAGDDIAYLPRSTTQAFIAIARNTVTKEPVILKITDPTQLTTSITAKSVTGPESKCLMQTDNGPPGVAIFCIDESTGNGRKMGTDSAGNIYVDANGPAGYVKLADAMSDIADLAAKAQIGLYRGTNSSTIGIFRGGSGSTFQSSVLESNFVGDSLAFLRTSTIAEGLTGSWADFVVAGRSPDNRSILLGYFNTSMEAYAVNPNGTMQFTTDRIVAIQTIAPDINILNFQLRWQNFTGTFDTTMGTCIGCTFDAMGTCQAEVEKIWGMYNNYNITINLTPSTTINMQDLQMCCRSLNTTVGLNTNCSTLLNGTGYGASTYSTNTCFTPASEAGKSYNTSDTTCVYLQNLTATGVQTPLGTIQPTATCEMIACEINGTWNSTNDKTFTINKTITVTAI